MQIAALIRNYLCCEYENKKQNLNDGLIGYKRGSATKTKGAGLGNIFTQVKNGESAKAQDQGILFEDNRPYLLCQEELPALPDFSKRRIPLVSVVLAFIVTL